MLYEGSSFVFTFINKECLSGYAEALLKLRNFYIRSFFEGLLIIEPLNNLTTLLF